MKRGYVTRKGDNWLSISKKKYGNTGYASNLLRTNRSVKTLRPGVVVQTPDYADEGARFRGRTPADYGAPKKRVPAYVANRTGQPQVAAQGVSSPVTTMGRTPYVRNKIGRTPAYTPVPLPDYSQTYTNYGPSEAQRYAGVTAQMLGAPQPNRFGQRGVIRATLPEVYQPYGETNSEWSGLWYRDEYGRMFNAAMPRHETVMMGIRRGEFPSIILAGDQQALGLNDDWLAQAGYFRDQYGNWNRQTYEDVGGGAQAGGGGAAGGGGGGGGGRRGGGGGGGGGGYEPQPAAPRASFGYPAAPAETRSGYFVGQPGQAGYSPTGRRYLDAGMGSITWRI